MSSSKKSTLVRNRAAAPMQISAEQILREAVDRQDTAGQQLAEPIVKIHDAEEYQDHLRDRRAAFEKNIRYRREDIGNWVQYSRFEEEQAHDLERARSIFERALEVSNSATLWLRYAELELRNEHINHARNVLDRAVQLWPRVDFLWYKYVYVEEMVQDVAKCRAVFTRWMKWQPDDNAWLSFARFETRQGNTAAAEAVLRDYVNTYPSARAFARFAKWAEQEAKDVTLARTIYEAAFAELEPEEVLQQARLFRQFAAFEERQGEYERARVVYQHAIQLLQLPPSEKDEDDLTDTERQQRHDLYQAYLTLEKKHGNVDGIEHTVLVQQRQQYKERLAKDPYDYDGWFEWAKLEELSGTAESTTDVYEQAVAQVPPTNTKNDWKRYIYLWIYYAVYAELQCGDGERAAQIYETCLTKLLIPRHKDFTFAKIWILAAQVFVRRKNLPKARQWLGQAIGYCQNKQRIFVEYIRLELALGEMDRCRKLYDKYVQSMPQACTAWTQYAALEESIGEIDRCRALLELAVAQTTLDQPEVVWKAYIDFELRQGESTKARGLYQRLLEKTQHVKVYISLAQFEATAGDGMEAARQVLEKAEDSLKQQQQQQDGKSPEERVLLLDAWRGLEQEHGTPDSVSAVEAKMPRRIKRKRLQYNEQGQEVGWEEYFDYQFPDADDEGGAAANFKILEMAAKWKAERDKNDDDSDLDSDDVDD